MSDLVIIEEAVGEIGKAPEERTTDELLQCAIVNIDKLKGPTSHQVSDHVQKILNLKKAGHSGTLDPQVTGVQPVAIGRGTKVVQFLLKSPKEYICLMRLHKEVPQEQVEQVLKSYIGKIEQLPPVKSAVKRQIRTRRIYEIKLIEMDKTSVLFRVKCQAGTYIRKLAHQAGVDLKTGAHMQELRRTQAGPINESDNLVNLDDLRDALHYYKKDKNEKFIRYCLHPIEKAVQDFKKCYVFDSALESLSHGRDLGAPGVSKLEHFGKGDMVAVMSLKGELVAVGEALMSTKEIKKERKGLAVKTSKVFFTTITSSKTSSES